MLNTIQSLRLQPPSLYLNLEGINLSCRGTVSIIQLFVEPLDHIYLIDIHCLDKPAFHTPNSNGMTLKSIFEDASTPKICFDARNGSANLLSQFQIRLQGVQDLQLMEMKTVIPHATHQCNGLLNCLRKDAGLSANDLKNWELTRNAGHTLCNPKKGGSYEVFNIRPMSPKMIEYCAQTVMHMPLLWRVYAAKIKPGALKQSRGLTFSSRSRTKPRRVRRATKPISCMKDTDANDTGFVGFSQRDNNTGAAYRMEKAYTWESTDLNYGLCDKDCGWCGRCMDGVDI